MLLIAAIRYDGISAREAYRKCTITNAKLIFSGQRMPVEHPQMWHVQCQGWGPKYTLSAILERMTTAIGWQNYFPVRVSFSVYLDKQ
jgi:hypothetical protein